MRIKWKKEEVTKIIYWTLKKFRPQTNKTRHSTNSGKVNIQIFKVYFSIMQITSRECFIIVIPC